MKKRLFVFLGIVICFSVINEVKADSALRTQTVYSFLLNDRPYNKPIGFQVQCFGTRPNYFGSDEQSEVQKIIDVTENCQEYGCKFDHNLFGYHAQIQYCDLYGETQGKKFTVKNFAGENLDKLICHPNNDRTYDILNSKGYFKTTPKYDECMDRVSDEYYPDGGSFLCHKYLELSSESECAGFGCILIDGQTYRFSDETNQCIAEMDSKEENCEKYLDDVSQKVKEQGLDFDQQCEAQIDLPVLSDNADEKDVQSQNIEDSGKKSGWQKWLAEIICWLKTLLGQKCP